VNLGQPTASRRACSPRRPTGAGSPSPSRQRPRNQIDGAACRLSENEVDRLCGIAILRVARRAAAASQCHSQHQSAMPHAASLSIVQAYATTSLASQGIGSRVRSAVLHEFIKGLS